jgi:hypothetical protein
MTLANLSVLAYQELTPMYNGYRSKQLIRAKSIVLEVLGRGAAAYEMTLLVLKGSGVFKCKGAPKSRKSRTTEGCNCLILMVSAEGIEPSTY